MIESQFPELLACGVNRRDATPPEVRAARERERELKELERATRTVFAFNLNIKADERDIYDFFSKAGQVSLGETGRGWGASGHIIC